MTARYTRLVATEGEASASLLVSSYYMIFAQPASWEAWTGLLVAAIISRGGDFRKIEWLCEPVGEEVDTIRAREPIL